MAFNPPTNIEKIIVVIRKSSISLFINKLSNSVKAKIVKIVFKSRKNKNPIANLIGKIIKLIKE
jgi:hypothetical protein